MRPKSHSLKIPLPSPEERERQRQESARALAQQAAQVAETPDLPGAIRTLLEALGLVRKNVALEDMANRERIRALVERVLADSAGEVPGPSSAQRMIDHLIQEVDADWAKRGL